MKRRMAVWRGLVRCEGIFCSFACLSLLARIYLSVSRCAVWSGLDSFARSLVLAFLVQLLRRRRRRTAGEGGCRSTSS